MEYTALYRRFRPMKFSEILGQEHITQTLRNQITANRVGHAYLFTGCRGCGKTSSAKVLARAVNCLNPQNGEPCNECEICKAALDGSLTDIVEMDAASNNGVDDIRAIRDEVNFLPTLAKYRVYIIDEVHMLSAGAFNALLKTLEEPPKHVKFILATTEPQKLPATILSRCQRFDFKKISAENIIKNLKNICKECKIEYDDGALNLIAELAEGAMRDALSILERCAQDGENKISEEKIKELVGIPKTVYIANIIESIINYDANKALIETKNIIDDGKDPANILFELVKYTRDLMLLKTTGNISNVYNKNDIELMKAQISKSSDERLLKIIYSLSELENDIRYSSQKNIVFQVGVMKLCTKETMSLEERIEKLEKSLPDMEKTLSTNIAKNVENAVASNIKMRNASGATNNGINANNSMASGSANINNSSNLVNGANPSKAGSTAGASVVNSASSNGNMSNMTSSNTINTKNSQAFWGEVIDTLKEERKPMLYSNLLNTKGVLIDDMTFGIEFPNGLNSFGRSVIERPENLAELKRLVSIQCKKDMRIKLIDNKANTKPQENAMPNIDLGIDINIVE